MHTFLVTNMFLLISFALIHESQSAIDPGASLGHDTVYQNPFCGSKSLLRNDSRYHIHSFSFVHGNLYIFTANDLFILPLLGTPPYLVSQAIKFEDLSNQLGNTLYQSSYSTNRLFTSVAFALDEQREVFVIALKMISDDYNDEFGQNQFGAIPYSWRVSTAIIMRNNQREYQHMRDFDYFFSASLSDKAYQLGFASRFISGDNYFFHISANLNSEIRIMRYDVADKLRFSISEYFLYKNIQTKYWILTTKVNTSMERISTASNTFLAKNGYIFKNRMYLTRIDSIEVYRVRTISADEIKLSFEKILPSYEMIECKPQNNSGQLFLRISYILWLLVIILAAITAICKRNRSGYCFLISSNLAIQQLENKTLYKC